MFFQHTKSESEIHYLCTSSNEEAERFLVAPYFYTNLTQRLVYKLTLKGLESLPVTLTEAQKFSAVWWGFHLQIISGNFFLRILVEESLLPSFHFRTTSSCVWCVLGEMSGNYGDVLAFILPSLFPWWLLKTHVSLIFSPALVWAGDHLWHRWMEGRHSHISSSQRDSMATVNPKCSNS